MADTLTFRARTILSRFPRHLALDEPGTLVGDVVETLSADLDRQTSQLGRVRTAHRFGLVDERHDLLLLIGLHRLGEAQFDLLDRRQEALAAVAAALASGDASVRDAARVLLPDLLGLPAEAWPTWPGEADATPAVARLAAAVLALDRYDARLAQVRQLSRSIIAEHRSGNGTIGAILGAAAAYLGLELRSLAHAVDGYWHLARCHDRLLIDQPQPPVGDAAPSLRTLTPMVDLLALEENPFTPTTLDPEPRHHGDLVTIARTGFDPVPVAVTVEGIGDSTVLPMVVQVDQGHGLVFTGSVGDGAQLVFTAAGRATLDGVEVGHRCFTFQGGVFADADATHAKDFCFADADPAGSVDAPIATFVTTAPLADGFDPAAVFPHAGGELAPAVLAVGESRFRIFVREASFGTFASPMVGPLPEPSPAVPITDAGLFDASLFADAALADPVLALGFAWQEREPFACRLWIPGRFRRLDQPAALAVPERLRLLLDRHRAAGISLSIAYADDRWTLGDGVLRDLGSDEAEGIIVVGSRLWDADAAPPDT